MLFYFLIAWNNIEKLKKSSNHHFCLVLSFLDLFRRKPSHGWYSSPHFYAADILCWSLTVNGSISSHRGLCCSWQWRNYIWCIKFPCPGDKKRQGMFIKLKGFMDNFINIKFDVVTHITMHVVHTNTFITIHPESYTLLTLG